MVPAYSHKVSRVSWYSGYRLLLKPFAYGAFTLSGWSFQGHLARLNLWILRSEPQNARTLVWALPRSLAATYGITVVFFSSGYLDVSVRRVPLLQAMYSPADDSSCLLPGSPIRTPPLLRFLTASRSFSQFGASFFSFEWPGIRRTPFLT